MNRRIGVIKVEEPKTKPKGDGWYKQLYVWDLKSLVQLRAYAHQLAQWTRLDITELTWCNLADVQYYADRPLLERRVFVYHEPTQQDKKTIKGSPAAGWTREDILRLTFRQSSPYTPSHTRRAAIPAPIYDIFDADARLLPAIGDLIAQSLSQATGINITFSKATLQTFPIEPDDR